MNDAAVDKRCRVHIPAPHVQHTSTDAMPPYDTSTLHCIVFFAPSFWKISQVQGCKKAGSTSNPLIRLPLDCKLGSGLKHSQNHRTHQHVLRSRQVLHTNVWIVRNSNAGHAPLQPPNIACCIPASKSCPVGHTSQTHASN